MTKNFTQLFDKMTPQEQAEIESFTVFLIARRKIKQKLLTDEISIEELMQLIEDGGSFDWLKSDAQNVYSVKDGEPVKWGKET